MDRNDSLVISSGNTEFHLAGSAVDEDSRPSTPYVEPSSNVYAELETVSDLSGSPDSEPTGAEGYIMIVSISSIQLMRTRISPICRLP